MPHAAQEVVRTTVAQDPAERAELETSTANALSSIFSDGDETLADEPSDAGKPSEEADKLAAAEEAPKEAAAEKEEKTEDEQDAPATAASDPAPKPTVVATPAAVSAVPAAYRRSLKAYQWSDEEIDEAAKANPASFLKMAERVHSNRVEETKRWADIGRHQKTATPAAAPAAPSKFDAKALRDKYGDEPFIAAMEAQAAQLEAANAFISQSRDRQSQQELETLTKQIDGYFGSKDMEPYHDHYGKLGTTLSEKQMGERQKVLETADLLISGARSMGRPITLDEALTMAHDSVSGPVRASVAVKQVQKQVQQRQQAISMRPSSRAAAPKAATRSDLEKTVGSKLATIFK